MDAPEASVGHTVYFPVNGRGALLFLGDGHAAQGDGEVAGTAIEVPLRARLHVDLIKGKSISLAALRNDESIMAVGAYRPLDDALRIAFTELVAWIHADTASRISMPRAALKVGRVHVTEMVDPNYVVIAIAEKKFLPPRKNGKPW